MTSTADRSGGIPPRVARCRLFYPPLDPELVLRDGRRPSTWKGLLPTASVASPPIPNPSANQADFSDPESQRLSAAAAPTVAYQLGPEAACEYLAELKSTHRPHPLPADRGQVRTSSSANSKPARGGATDHRVSTSGAPVVSERISVASARAILGRDALGLSDAEVLDACRQAEMLAEMIVEMFFALRA